MFGNLHRLCCLRLAIHEAFVGCYVNLQESNPLSAHGCTQRTASQTEDGYLRSPERTQLAKGQKPNRTPSEHPIQSPTKIGPKMGGEFTDQPKWNLKTVLTHSQLFRRGRAHRGLERLPRARGVQVPCRFGIFPNEMRTPKRGVCLLFMVLHTPKGLLAAVRAFLNKRLHNEPLCSRLHQQPQL